MSSATQKLRHRITLQVYGETQNEDGDIVRGWSDFKSNVPAEWKPGQGSERFNSEALREKTQGVFRIRWMPGVNAAMRVWWEGKPWEIELVQSDATARRDLFLTVSDGVTPG